MEPEGFSERSGTISMPSGKAYYAFTPKTLPIKINVDEELASLLAEASRQLGLLDGLGYHLKNPKLLMRPYMQREAVLSTRIEGTQSSLSEVLLYEAKKDGEKPSRDLFEVLNYISALEYGLEAIKKEEISQNLVLRMHEILLEKVRGADKSPGKLRTMQNWIGPPGSDVNSATFVPPPPEKVENLLENLFTYMGAAESHPLIQIGLSHYQFEAVHPFRDGNGRLGRLLIILYVIKKSILSKPLLYMSPYFERNDKQYRQALLEVSRSGTYEQWLKFFLKGVVEQAKESLTKTKLLIDYHDKCLEKLRIKGNQNAILLMEDLFANPYITVSNATKLLKKTFPTAERAIEVLIKEGILEEATKQSRNRMFVAREILKIIDDK